MRPLTVHQVLEWFLFGPSLSTSPLRRLLQHSHSYLWPYIFAPCDVRCCCLRRPVWFWLNKAQSLLYCNEHGVLGFFSEEVKSCICPMEHPSCQGAIPCIVGTSTLSCSSCATDNATRCGACHHGNILHLGSCRPSVAPSLDHYLNLDLDIPDVEVLKATLAHTKTE